MAIEGRAGFTGPRLFYPTPDRVVNKLHLPAMFSWLVGTGPGAGMGLLIVFCGLASALVGLLGYFVPFIYYAEKILPDYETFAKAEPA